MAIVPQRSGAHVVALLACITWLLAPAAASANDKKSGGKIEETRERINESSRERDHRKDSGSDEDDEEDYDEDEEDDDDDVAATIVWYMITSPFWGPTTAVEDPPYLRPFTFAPYPYQGSARGYHERSPPDAPSPPWEIALRTQYSYENHFDDLEANRLRVSARTNRRLDLDGEVTRYDEPLDGGEVDHLWHYKGMLSFSFAVSPRVHFESGIGVRALRFKAGDTVVSFNWRYAAEFFPGGRVHIWMIGEIGGGEEGVATEVEAGMGVLFNRVEAFAGIRNFRIVGINFGGPEIGLAVWL